MSILEDNHMNEISLLNFKKDPVVTTDLQTIHLHTGENDINANWLYALGALSKE